MEKKLYRVHIGLVDDGKMVARSLRKEAAVFAGDAAEAIKRARLKKNEYPESVDLIAAIDRP